MMHLMMIVWTIIMVELREKVCWDLEKKAASKAIKVSEYTSKDLLILSQAFIHTSENSVEGVAWKSTKFWDEVAESFNL